MPRTFWHRFGAFRDEARNRVVLDAVTGELIPVSAADWKGDGATWHRIPEQPPFSIHKNANGFVVMDLSQPKGFLPNAKPAEAEKQAKEPAGAFGGGDGPPVGPVALDGTFEANAQPFSDTEPTDRYGRSMQGSGRGNPRAVEDFDAELAAKDRLAFWRSPEGIWYAMDRVTLRTAQVSADDVPPEARSKGWHIPEGWKPSDWVVSRGREVQGHLHLSSRGPTYQAREEPQPFMRHRMHRGMGGGMKARLSRS